MKVLHLETDVASVHPRGESEMLECETLLWKLKEEINMVLVCKKIYGYDRSEQAKGER